MGTAFASFVTGVLLVFTSFDERQNVTVDALGGNIVVIKTEAQQWLTQEVDAQARSAEFAKQIENMIANADKLRGHFVQRLGEHPDQAEHIDPLIEHVDSISSEAKDLRAKSDSLAANPADLINEADKLLEQTTELKKQAPRTLFRLRLVEIGLPLVLSIVSILLTLRYPLTEARCYDIKEALKKRHAELAT
jgi:Na+/melibiose symporter-like transporter